jgi:Mrp family chromosome partitioning ATPase
LQNVKNKILILSGKGGVGKSTVCGQISYAFAAHFEKEEKQVSHIKKNYIF